MKNQLSDRALEGTHGREAVDGFTVDRENPSGAFCLKGGNSRDSLQAQKCGF
jgi:hypothetical protein